MQAKWFFRDKIFMSTSLKNVLAALFLNLTCSFSEIDPFVVYSNLNHIRRTNVNGTQSDILFPTRHSNIIDFDYINQVSFH